MTAGAERGRLVAAMLVGAWRVTPPPCALPRTVLADVNPLLLAGGVGALAWRRVSLGGDVTLRDSPEAFELRQAYRLHSLHAALHVQQIEDALTRLRASGVEPLLAKGWAAARHYPEPGLRPYGDIDLYVRPEQHQVAQAALFASGIPPAPVDLHSGCPALEDRGMDQLYARSETTLVGDVEARVLGPEDHLHLLCVHMLSHGVCRPLWLCDIGAALERLPRAFDWDRFWGPSSRREEWLRCALTLSHEMLGASLDETPLAQTPYALSSWVARAVREQWGSTFRPRQPMESFLRNPGGLLREIRHHWPNPVEATVGVGGAFTQTPRWPHQLAHSFLRSTRWAARLARFKLSRKRRSTNIHTLGLETP